MLELVLASQSPRRRDLLRDAGYVFRVLSVKVSEIIDENLNPQEVATDLARLKARTAIEEHNLSKQQGFLVLGADTIVCLDGRILGKPRDSAEAIQFLRLLSGKVHSVITGIALYQTASTNFWSGAAETKVAFHELSEPEILSYVNTGDPLDKAGAYGIQGEGGKFVSSYIGSKSNVVGLPLELFRKVLNENEWNIRRQSSTPS